MHLSKASLPLTLLFLPLISAQSTPCLSTTITASGAPKSTVFNPVTSTFGVGAGQQVLGPAPTASSGNSPSGSSPAAASSSPAGNAGPNGSSAVGAAHTANPAGSGSASGAGAGSSPADSILPLSAASASALAANTQAAGSNSGSGSSSQPGQGQGEGQSGSGSGILTGGAERITSYALSAVLAGVFGAVVLVL